MPEMRMRTYIPALLLALLCAAAGPAFAINTPYTVSGDYVIFNIDSKTISGTGKVRLLYHPITITADSIQIDVSNHILKAMGNVQIVTSVVPEDSESEKAEESETTSVEDEIENATSLIGGKASETTFDENGNENVSYLIVREAAGDQKIYVGDTLVYDLNFMQGALVQTRGKVRKIYLWGETLEETATLQKLSEHIDLSDDPATGDSSIVANRFRISPNARYEAWHAGMWVKGNKIITLPYFTNTGRGMMPGKWRLKKASYSTNTNLSITSEFRYKDAAGKRGVITFNYKDKAERHLALNLRQQFRINRKTSSTFAISNFLAGGKNYNLTLNRRRSRYTQNLALRYRPKEYRNLTFNTTLPWKNSPIQTSLNYNKNLLSKYNAFNLNMFTGGRSRYFGGRRNLGYRLTGSMQFNKYDYSYGSSDSVANSYVGVSFFRSAIRAGKGGLVSTTVNLGHSASTKGDTGKKFGGTVNYNRQFGSGGIFNCSYSYSKNRLSGSSAPAMQRLSFSLNFSRIRRWNARLASMFNINTHKFSDLSLFFDYKVNKNFNLSTNFLYSLEDHRFASGRYLFRYNLLGTMINTTWNKENNDFVVDLNSQF